MNEEYDFDLNDLGEMTGEDRKNLEWDRTEDALGHVWGMGWEDSDKPHPGFGGTQNIYGGYVDQCEKCGLYGYEYKEQKCGDKVR